MEGGAQVVHLPRDMSQGARRGRMGCGTPGDHQKLSSQLHWTDISLEFSVRFLGFTRVQNRIAAPPHHGLLKLSMWFVICYAGAGPSMSTKRGE